MGSADPDHIVSYPTNKFFMQSSCCYLFKVVHRYWRKVAILATVFLSVWNLRNVAARWCKSSADKLTSWLAHETTMLWTWCFVLFSYLFIQFIYGPSVFYMHKFW